MIDLKHYTCWHQRQYISLRQHFRIGHLSRTYLKEELLEQSRDIPSHQWMGAYDESQTATLANEEICHRSSSLHDTHT